MENYQVGSEIGYNTSRNYHSATFMQIDEVAKITKSQVTTKKGYVFDLNTGKQRKSPLHSYPDAYLVPVSEVKKIREATEKRNKQSVILSELVRKLGDRNMVYHITDDQFEICKNLLESLKK